MGEQWIEASKIKALGIDTMALCLRLHSGLVRARARLLMVNDQDAKTHDVPRAFWWAEGHEALDQDWESGDFSTWLKQRDRLQAFGVTFALPDVLQMLPVEQRATTARSLSVVTNPDWLSAKDARQFAYTIAKVSPSSAGAAIIAQAQLGFLTGRAVIAQGSSDSHGSAWTWEEREWDIEQWFWDGFTTGGSSSQDWELGVFSGHGFNPRGHHWMTLRGVHILKSSLANMLPDRAAPESAPPPMPNKGGRPPASFHDELMCAIWGLIHQGDLMPKRQADIEDAIQDWVTRNGHDLGATITREKARKIWTAFSEEVENPSQ